MSTSNRRKRESELAQSKALRRFKKHAVSLQLHVLEQVGVNTATIDDAIQLLEEANIFLPMYGFMVSQSSSPNTGVYLMLSR